MTHSPPEPRLARLADLVEYRLSPTEEAVVRRLLQDGGPRADHALRWTRDFLALAAAVPLHDPPPAVAERLTRSFLACQEATAELEETSIEVTLALLFDSSKDRELVGTRSTDVLDDVVHLAYSSDHADLVLDISRTPTGDLRIEGQILPLEAGAEGPFESLLGLDGAEARTAVCDSHGRFSFDDVRPGPQQLRTGNGHISLVADLDLGVLGPVPTTSLTPRSTHAPRGAS